MVLGGNTVGIIRQNKDGAKQDIRGGANAHRYLFILRERGAIQKRDGQPSQRHRNTLAGRKRSHKFLPTGRCPADPRRRIDSSAPRLTICLYLYPISTVL